jgi:hypothetical protein
VHGPGTWVGTWKCGLHGQVHPLRTVRSLTAEGIDALLLGAEVPVWVPWPLPMAWLVTGFGGAGDEQTGIRGCVVALSGPSPVGGPAEMLLVSEEMGIGLGAGFAGLDGPDPGTGFASGPSHGLVRYGHHQFPLWHVDAADRAAFAGEVLGNWLWLILWPVAAGMLLVDPLELRDLRDPGQELDLPFGARSPRLP